MWFEIVFGVAVHGHTHKACAIVETMNPTARASELWDILSRRDCRVDPVLVRIPDGIEDSEFVSGGTPSMIWLKVYDVGDCGGQYVLNESIELVDTVVRRVHDDREGCTVIGLTASSFEVQQGQIPRDVIEGRTEVVDNIAQNRGERWRGCGIRGNLIDHIVEVLRIELMSETIRVSIKEGPNLPLKFVQVFARPFDLEAGTSDIGHDVCSDLD
jgi:hypothetical protein